MKFAELKTIGHNLGHSLSSGVCLLVGYSNVDIYQEANKTADGYIEVDFLTGQTNGATISRQLARTIESYRDIVPQFCKTHGYPFENIAKLSVTYYPVAGQYWGRFRVVVEDTSGRGAIDEYSGFAGKRPVILDELGRARKQPSRNYNASDAF
ncbi:hypothetical protein [Parvularcula marina]|uniref:Uncharacterized protein n=1 Tax=Parvularcula marina TaxID=2292771 RepID=A0A371REZ7_9PROT|nr:hypothetical protein [Parvularcula marina]RFB04026.1 hypothetical protein DX908_01245 [Parvularcula marina]